MKKYISFLVLSSILISCFSKGNLPSEPIELNKDLLALYTFNGNANDISGNNNNGTVYNTTFEKDRFGELYGAYKFDDGAWITVGDSLDLKNNSMTLCVWMKSEDFNQWAKIISKGQSIFGYPFNSGYSLRIVPPEQYNTPSGEYELWFNIIDDNNNNVNVGYPVSKLSKNTYILVTGILNRGADSSMMKLYVNKDLVVLKKVEVGYSDTNMPLSFGALDRGYGRIVDEFFNGVIDEIRIYNRVLNETEIHYLVDEKR